MQNYLFNKVFRVLFPHRDVVSVKREYHLPNSLNLTVKLSPDGWFVVTSPELPGFVTQARSHDELIEMVNDAVLTYFDVPKRVADVVYDQLKFGDQTIQYNGQLVTRSA